LRRRLIGTNSFNALDIIVLARPELMTDPAVRSTNHYGDLCIAIDNPPSIRM
jgi:hypothetical protein